MTPTGPETPTASPNAHPAPASPALAWRSGKALALFLSIFVVVLVGDLWLKQWAFDNVAGRPIVLPDPPDPQVEDPSVYIPWHRPVVLIPHVLEMKLVYNIGAVFGKGRGLQRFFVAASLIACGAILWFFVRSRRDAWVLHLALALILAGATGNLHDRIRFNAVRDMLLMLPDTRLWPWVFNIADASLMIGVGLLMIRIYRQEPPPQTGEANPG